MLGLAVRSSSAWVLVAALAALDMALANRGPRRGLVHHSDRGSTGEIKCSMSRKGENDRA
jgi:transposase InsO family protein